MEVSGHHRAGLVGEVSGKLSWAEIAPKLTAAAGLERSSERGWTQQSQLKLHMLRGLGREELECEAWQR